MDLIYDDGSKELSLQSLTTTTIIQKILEDEGMLPNCARDEKTIASIAIKVVNNLPLPSLLKWQLRRMVLPIMEEMQSWYRYKYEATRVVLTQNGTVDLPKNIRNMLNDKNVSLMQRFKVACEHCLEQEIFDIGAQINFPHYFGRNETHPILENWSLDNTWYKIYGGNFHAKLGLKDISENFCTQGFVQALYMCNSSGVKYFMEGGCASDDILVWIRSMHFEISLTPDECIKIFKNLKEDEKRWHKSRFSAALLKALLKWPYQHQFMKAAERLAENMDGRSFLQVAARIANKATDGWEDHDYKGLFIDFWESGSKSKIGYIDPAEYRYGKDLLYNVILMRDERLAHFVLDNTTETFMAHHLFNFRDNSVCLRLIFEKHFEALELFIKVCRVNKDTLIVKIQNNIKECLDHGVFYLDLYKKNMLREFLSRMDKLKPQTSETSI